MYEVRALTTPEDILSYLRMSNAAFNPEAPVEPAASRWLRSLLDSPDYEPDFVRGVCVGGEIVGGCIALHPRLRFGTIELPTTGLSAVCTRPDYRRRGVARALLEDTTAMAVARGDALLLLDGIPDFYGQFGYVDVVDNPDIAISRSAALALPISRFTVRRAVVTDAPALLDLHYRHFGSRRGGFRRSLADARHGLLTTEPDRTPIVAVDASDRVRGALSFSWDRRGSRAGEVAADDWVATVALLRWHAESVEVTSSDDKNPVELRWPVPLYSQLHDWLRQHLPIRTEIWQRPNAGWMARETSAHLLANAAKPYLRENASASGLELAVEIVLRGTDSETVSIVAGASSQRGERSTDRIPIELTATELVQLLFGFGSAAAISRESGKGNGRETADVLSSLIPREPVFIPGSDSF